MNTPESQDEPSAIPPNNERRFENLTGIPDVDAALEPICGDGGVILVGAITGQALPVFTAQVAARMIRSGKSVAYLGTGLGNSLLAERDVIERITSSGVEWPWEKLSDGGFHIKEGVLRIPYDKDDNPEFTTRALAFNHQREANLRLHVDPQFKMTPVETLGMVLEAVEDVDCFILDPISVEGNPADLSEGPRIAGEIMKVLEDWARSNKALVLVTCTLRPDDVMSIRKTVTSRQIYQFPSIAKCCNVFIGITHLRSSVADFGTEGVVSISQYFCIDGPFGEKRVPVNVSSTYQRYEARKELDPARDQQRRIRAAEMVRKSHFGGYTQFSREIFQKLRDLRCPECINVYTLCLLVAQGNGDMLYSQEKIGKILGIVRKTVGRTMKRLVNAGLLEKTKRMNGRAAIYDVIDSAEQAVMASGYFMIAHNLRDQSRKELLGNPLLFRVWLCLIHDAQFSRDTGFLERGQIVLRPDEIADAMGDKVADVKRAIETFNKQGRLRKVELEYAHEVVFEVVNYDIYQSGSCYKYSNAHEASLNEANQEIAGQDGDLSLKRPIDGQ